MKKQLQNAIAFRNFSLPFYFSGQVFLARATVLLFSTAFKQHNNLNLKIVQSSLGHLQQHDFHSL